MSQLDISPVITLSCACDTISAPVEGVASRFWRVKFSGRAVSLELFPKAVDGRDNSSGSSFSIDEHDAVDQIF